MLSIIVAIDEGNAIGRGGDLLCHLSGDLKHFKALTTGHTVIMGRNTYMSLPRRPLPNRRNIVLTTDTATVYEGAEVAHSVEEAMALTRGEEEVFVIGGGTIYRQMLPYADKLYLTLIHHSWTDADTFFSTINPADWEELSREPQIRGEKDEYDYTFVELRKIK